ncbi:MAG: branched-chain amino acid ABC transporter substrate-binding protein [Actinocatenispora sp.]
MKSKFLRGLGVVPAVLLVVGASAACTSADGDTASGGKCGSKIAFFGARTGPNANLGINIYNGVKLAVDQYNKKNSDCKVVLESKDSQGDEKQAPGLAQQLVQDSKVVGVIGPAFSGESEAADGIFDKGGLPIITASATNPTLSQKGWKIFHRALGNDNSQGPAAASYIKDTVKAKKVFVIDDTTAYGKGLADVVKSSLGSMVTGTDTVQPKQVDFQATVAKVKSSKADAVFYGGYYAEAGPFLKQLRGKGVKATFVTDDGAKDEGLVKGAGNKAAEGAVMTCPCIPGDEAKGTFFEDYKKAFSKDPGTYGPEAYDAANVFLDGVKAGKTSRKAMTDFIGAYDKDGVSKHIKFDSHGEIVKSQLVVWAYTVKNGEIVKDREISPTS